jgi:protein-S-isoprenylcysteine O-methyltransferase Ste14
MTAGPLPLPFAGGPAYASIFWTAYTIWVVPELFWSVTKRPGAGAQKRDRGSYLGIILALYAGLGADFALAFRLPQARIMWHPIVFFYLGIFLMLAGIAFRFYAMRTLGRFFTYAVAVRKEQTVVQAGPYRCIRHPSYSGALVTLIGLGLALGNWAGLLALICAMMIGYGYRMHVEESALVAGIGAPYEEYRQRTKRLVPFIY